MCSQKIVFPMIRRMIQNGWIFLRNCWRISVLLPILVLYSSCGEDLTPEDTTPPAPPIIIPKSPETQFIQEGIDSEPGNSDQDYWIRIEWEWNEESDLLGYYIYRWDERDTLGSFEQIRDQRLEVNLRREDDPVPYYTDQAPILQPDQITGFSHGFYYFIRAYDEVGNVSAHSDTVYYRHLKKPTGLRINGTPAVEFALLWDYYWQEDWNYFFLRVYPQGFPNIRVWSYRANLLAAPFSVNFNQDGTVNTDFLRTASDSLRAGTYTWTVDVVDDFDPLHPAGAETKGIFTVAP